jgi:hypothetical protein
LNLAELVLGGRNDDDARRTSIEQTGERPIEQELATQVGDELPAAEALTSTGGGHHRSE